MQEQAYDLAAIGSGPVGQKVAIAAAGNPVQCGHSEQAVKLSVEVSQAEEEKLAQEARRLNVSVEELAAAAVHDLLGQRDAEFDRAAARVLEKNRELYRRLA